MKMYFVYLKDRKEPLQINADSVQWEIKDSLREILPVKKLLFKENEEIVASVLIDQLQAFTSL